MKITSKPLAIFLIVTFFCIVFAGFALQVLWTDWAIQRIFNKEYAWWQLFAGLFLLELLAPKALQGISWIILFLMTLYIWLASTL